MSRSKASSGPMRAMRTRQMLDLDQLLIDAGSPRLVPRDKLSPEWDNPICPGANPTTTRVSGQFLPAGQAGQGFLMGAGGAHLFRRKTHHPRAPLGEGNQSRLENRKTPCPSCPFFMRVSIHEGCALILPGQVGLSRACPACPDYVASATWRPATGKGRVLLGPLLMRVKGPRSFSRVSFKTSVNRNRR